MVYCGRRPSKLTLLRTAYFLTYITKSGLENYSFRVICLLRLGIQVWCYLCTYYVRKNVFSYCYRRYKYLVIIIKSSTRIIDIKIFFQALWCGGRPLLLWRRIPLRQRRGFACPHHGPSPRYCWWLRYSRPWQSQSTGIKKKWRWEMKQLKKKNIGMLGWNEKVKVRIKSVKK